MGNVHMEATQINYRGGAVKKSVEEAIKDAIELTPEQKTNINKIPTIEAAVATKAAQSIIAPEFDSEEGVYAIGDLVMHEGKLYEFTTAHETAGDWDSTEVTEKTVADEIDSVKSGLTNVNSKLSPTSLTSTVASGFTLASWGSVRAYKVGNLAIISVSGLKAISAITTETLAITIDGITFTTALRGAVSPEGTVAVGDNGSVYIDGVSADTNLFFEIVGVLS